MNSKDRTLILKKIKTTSKEDSIIKKRVSKFIEELKSAKNELKLNCDFFVGGSFGKGTYIKGDFDVDIFVRFNEDNNLSSKVENILKKAKKKLYRQKGSRDYFQVHENKITFEIVPIKKISNIEDAENTTDHSPFHVNFVKEKISKNKKLADEIRLAKQFFKAQKLYGAESYIGGFSGHVIDLLVIYFGSFTKMVSNIAEFREETIVDINRDYKTQKELLSKIEKDKHSNLILVDPILKTRNAARALTSDMYYKAIFVCSQKVSKLTAKDFVVEITNKKIRDSKSKKFAKDNNLKLLRYRLEIKKNIQSNDIVGSKLLKTYERLKRYFESLEFRIFKSEFFISFDEEVCEFCFFLEKTELSKFRKVMGPKVNMKSDIKKFILNKKNVFVERDRVYAYEKRKIQSINSLKKISKKDFEKLLGKKLDFVKKVSLN